jgi:RNA polymerase sigma factor (sigma-70 family)
MSGRRRVPSATIHKRVAASSPKLALWSTETCRVTLPLSIHYAWPFRPTHERAPAGGGRTGPADIELIASYKATRNPVHVGVLFERYAHLVLGVSLRYLRRREDAEDAVMEVYERLLSALLEHEITNFRSWLYSVVANHCRMTLRRRKGTPTPVVASEELLDAVLAAASPSPEEDRGERLLEALPSSLAQLGAGQRRCLELFYLEDLSYAEVATRTGFTLNEVKSHIQNGKRNLRTVLLRAANRDG